jgi:photosystem II stability/assembly factor-like uncharacterized protein
MHNKSYITHRTSYILTLLIAFFLLPIALTAQTVKLLHSGNKISLRGLSVVDDKTIWVSGSGGTVGQSLDSGNTWKWMTVKGFEKIDFRDIEAFDKTTAIIMGITSPAYILKTVDGGDTWKVMYENKDTSMFLDAMEFWNEQSGIVIGDPINGKMFVARTFDEGKTWQHIPPQNMPNVVQGEACFASSGTNVRKLNKKEAVFVTGGIKSRMYIRDRIIEMPIIQNKETTGANSVAVKDSKTMIVVGGDFNTKDSSTQNCVITFDGGKTFTTPTIPPHGYRSCVEFIKRKTWVSCGLNGVDISTDNGNTWQWISKESFHAVRKAKDGKSVFFSGGNGRIGRLIL